MLRALIALSLALLVLPACGRFSEPDRVHVSLAPAVQASHYDDQRGAIGGVARLLLPIEHSVYLGALAEAVRYGDLDAQLLVLLLRFRAGETSYGRFDSEVGVGVAHYPQGDVETAGALLLGPVFTRPITGWLEWETAANLTFVPVIQLDGDRHIPLLSLSVSTGLAVRF